MSRNSWTARKGNVGPELVDVNLLLYAYDEAAPLHARAKRWLAARFASDETTGIALASALAFVRITTNPRVFRRAFGVAEVCGIVDEWFTLPNVFLIQPTDRHWPIFVELATASQSRGALIPDADLAASAFEHGAAVCTHDRDFSRFGKVAIEFPLSR